MNSANAPSKSLRLEAGTIQSDGFQNWIHHSLSHNSPSTQAMLASMSWSFCGRPAGPPLSDPFAESDRLQALSLEVQDCEELPGPWVVVPVIHEEAQGRTPLIDRT